MPFLQHIDLAKKTEEWAHKNLGGVIGVRLVKELKGEPANEMKDELVVKKMIATTRMFGSPLKISAILKKLSLLIPQGLQKNYDGNTVQLIPLVFL